MPANTNPIFGLIARNPSLTLTTGANTYTGADATLLLTADASNGSKLSRLRLGPRGVNAASIIRIYKAVGGTGFALLQEVALAATTASSGTANIPIVIPMDMQLGASVQIYVQLSATVAGGWDVTAELADY